MAISKITLNGVTQMDVTQKTVTANTMLNGITSLKNDGTDITGNIASKSSSDLTVSGATVTAPAGYYGSAATKSVSSMTLPTSASASATSGYTSKATISRSTSDQYINIPTGYNSSGAYYKVSAVADGTAGTPTATKGTVSNHAISVTPSVTNTTGYITGGTKTGTAVSVSASELVSGTKSITSSGTTDVTNYASASVAAGSVGSPTATKGTVTNHQVTVTPSVSYNAGYIAGGTSSGTAVTVKASDLVSGTLSITSSGTKDVTNYASASVAAGTEGTPTATKGTVSGNQVTVTPSVTNSAGYISGGTHTGTGVTVAASELVSGSNTLLMNGTFDVTNLASVITSFPNGFDCEYGEFTPATDEVTHNISFTKTHYGLPFIAMVIDKDGYDSSADTNHTMVYFNWQGIFSNGVYSTSSSVMMGEVLARYRTTSLVTKNYTIWYSETNSSDASTYYPRYWVTETGMKAEVGSTSYWRASRTYKWFAAWKPTVMTSWERGSINTSTGSTEESQNRISTSSFIHVRQIGNYFQVYVPSGARIYVTGYTSNYAFVPMTSAWQTGTVLINTTISGYSTVEYIKITASYTDDSVISDVQMFAKDIIIRGVE